MNRLLAYLLLVSSVLCFAEAPHIKSGATVYIEPMDGYEAYLAAAITKKDVPLVITDENKADYIIRSTVHHAADPYESNIACISVVDVHSSQVVFFTCSPGKIKFNWLQNTAENCVQQLQEFIEKGKK